MNLIVMGPQGSGKSTQAELLAEKLELSHLQTGKLYRQMMRQDSDLGRKVKSFLEKGHLVPDKEHNEILRQEVSRLKYKDGFVLDGSPRKLSQAKNQPFKVDKVFYLQVSDEEGIKRLLKRKRADDTPELIMERLRIYHQDTEPILDFYRQKGILEEVDGERAVKVIFEDIMKRLRQ